MKQTKTYKIYQMLPAGFFTENNYTKYVYIFLATQYGSTGCGVFKGGIQNQRDSWLEINCSQMKLLNFENWSSSKLSKIGHDFIK